VRDAARGSEARAADGVGSRGFGQWASIDKFDRDHDENSFPFGLRLVALSRFLVTFFLPLGAPMKYDEDATPDDAHDGIGTDDEVRPLEERLSALRTTRGSAGGFSPQARQRIEYLQELRRLRAQIDDDGFDEF
jgi:hypothetical protein